MDEKLIYEGETYAIRGAIFEVYKTLGDGYLEEVYQNALEEELRSFRNLLVEEDGVTPEEANRMQLAGDHFHLEGLCDIITRQGEVYTTVALWKHWKKRRKEHGPDIAVYGHTRVHVHRARVAS